MRGNQSKNRNGMKNSNTYLKIWNEIKSEVETGITNEDEFAAGFQNAWSEQEDIASSKLMQLTFAHALLKSQVFQK